ncbi:HIRAN domain-containing protein [Methanobrevibacter millerae]|uniref:HIRAN domain-containing protein n=1 Tax=Methanobrevibacter millerae TaxID=230361 RepID=UPI001E50F666|nr:HIRAN domain-containing protein [Methanobrevibacter millerae]
MIMMSEIVTQDLFATVVGLKNYKGNQVFKLGSIVKLIKEPDNDFDTEAIKCELNYSEKQVILQTAQQL